jgi:hypothetical protein
VYILHGRRIGRGALVEQSLAATFDKAGVLLNAFPPSFDDAAPAEDPARERPSLTWATALVRRAGESAADGMTLAEMLSAADVMFGEADTDRDGVLAVPELSAYMDVLVPRN